MMTENDELFNPLLFSFLCQNILTPETQEEGNISKRKLKAKTDEDIFKYHLSILN